MTFGGDEQLSFLYWNCCSADKLEVDNGVVDCSVDGPSDQRNRLRPRLAELVVLGDGDGLVVSRDGPSELSVSQF